MQQESGSLAPNDETYLFELWDDVWRERWLIIGISFAIALLSVVTVLVLPSWYRAYVVLAPTEKKTSIGGLAGQLGGLASLAGISVGGGDSSEAIAVLKSRDLTREFIQEQGLLPVLFAGDWDAKAGNWKQSDPEDQPDIREAVRVFDRKVRTVEEDRKTKLVILSIEWKDAKLAAKWANLLADRLNDRMRLRALADAQTNVEYLQAQLSITTTVALQQAVSRLLEGEMEKVMLARGNKDFAFRIVDRAEVPKRRSKPQRALVVVVSTVIGGALSVLFVAMRAMRRRRIGASPPGPSLLQPT